MTPAASPVPPRRGRMIGRRATGASMVALSAIVLAWLTPAAAAQTSTIEIELILQVGGKLSGLLVDHDDHGLVVVHEKIPYVFAWTELESGSAWRARTAALAHDRGGREKLTAADHMSLGRMALALDRQDLAINAFQQAERLDPGTKSAAREAMQRFRRRGPARRQTDQPLVPPAEAAGEESTGNNTARISSSESTLEPWETTTQGTTDDVRAHLQRVYETYGRNVREVFGADNVTLIETENFLIWTDWDARHHARLTDWLESMYAAMLEQFRLPGDTRLFPARCPVFVWQSEKRFHTFAQQFDGFAGTGALGYTRSIERHGHVHLVLWRKGNAPADFDRFACTLVHEGTHAVVHRLHESRLIPHWINEGLAEWMADRVLGERCPARGNADLLARQFVRYHWPVRDLLESEGPIGVEQYALAHSVVAFMIEGRPERFAAFVRRLKQGAPPAEALAATYDGLTLADLESQWRAAIAANPDRDPPAEQREKLPWKAGD